MLPKTNSSSSQSGQEPKPGVQSQPYHVYTAASSAGKSWLGRRWQHLRHDKVWFKRHIPMVVLVGLLLGLVILYIVPYTRYGIIGRFEVKNVSIMVVDHTTRLPVGDAVVGLARRTILTDVAGSTQFIAIPVGDYTVTVSHPGYDTLQQRIAVPIWTTLHPVVLQLNENSSYSSSNQNSNNSSGGGQNNQNNQNSGNNGGNNNGGGGGGGCNPRGVTKHQDGSYSFASLAISSQGKLVDSNSCQVSLVGGEGKDAGEENNPEGEYSVSSLADFNYVDGLVKLEPTMNLIRVPVYDTAWVKNDIVQHTKSSNFAGLTYQQFVIAYVQAMEKRGLYVELDNYSQNNGHRNDFPDISLGVKALSQLAATFKGDPAVLFDVRNESPNYKQYDRDTILSQDLQLLSAVQGANPSAIKVVYDDYIDYLAGHPKLFYNNAAAITNLVMDEHLYSGQYAVGRKIGHPPQWGCLDPNSQNSGNSYWPIVIAHYTASVIPFLQANHASLMLNEWGGNCDWPTYNTDIANFIINDHLVGMSYFYPIENWYANTYHNSNGLNPIGYNNAQLVTTAYTAILSGTQSPSSGKTASGQGGGTSSQAPPSFVDSVLSWLN